MAKVSLRAYNREIETMIDSGHLDEAIANCRHILKTFPKHIETYRLLGKAYLEYKRYPEAVDVFSRVLVAVPDDFVAHVGMSIIRDEENRLDDAIWHMERAFETQPSNAAIQSELQRLYGRRDGVQPPRIRMTRGALAHMYVQGELYPQAISEIKSVLKEDGGRVDMQALLARACYRSGLKNEAADVASSILRTYPYCLDANRVLFEILGSDRSESAQVYRQRVVELDPYAAHVMGTVFQSNEAPEAAVNVERLDWNGQPVSLQPDWATTQAITLEESESQEEQPDWLRSVFDEPRTQPPPQSLGPSRDQPRVVPAFDTSLPPASTGEPQEPIPDFLREAGWGKATGAFDESKSSPAYEEPVTEPPIAKGELPDWVKAMAPVEAQQPAEEEEELPDWISKIGSGAPAASSDSEDQLDWIRQLDQSAQVSPSESQPNWLNEMRQSEPSGPSAADDTPDWLKGLGESESVPASTPTEQPDWESQLEQPAQAQSEAGTSEDQLDWLKQLDSSEQAAVSGSEERPDWLKGLDSESTPAPTSTERTDWTSQPEQPSPVQPEAQPSDDQLDWLKGFDQPEQPVAASSDDQPDWLKGFESESKSPQTGELDWMKQIGEQAEPGPSKPSPEVESTAAVPTSSELDSLDRRAEQSIEPVSELHDQSLGEEVTAEPQKPVASAGTDQLGTSEQERDDSFAWLESLAARQGASEGLLTKPEERMEEEPDWVKRAKGLSTDDVPTQPAPSVQPSADLEKLGTSEQERDDSFAWLESLAARQGASEGLLTKPEERMEEEPDWVKQAKDLSQTAEQSPTTPPAAEETSSMDDTGVWLRSLEKEEPADEPVSAKDATGIWLKSLDEGLDDLKPAQPAEEQEPEIPAWMQSVEAEESAQISVPPAATEEAATEASDWMRSTDQTAEVRAEPSTEQQEAEIPAWMPEITAEQSVETSAPPATAEEVAAEESGWMRPTEEQVEFQPTEQAVGAHEMQAEQPAPMDDLPEWMQFIEEKESAEASAPAAPAEEATAEATDWMASIEETVVSTLVPEVTEEKVTTEEEIPAWLSSLDEEETRVNIPGISDPDLPAWLRGEEEAAPETSDLEPTRATDWQPVEQKQPEPVSEVVSEPPAAAEEMQEPVVSALEEQEAPGSMPKPGSEPVAPTEETISTLPVDPILGQARDALSKGDIAGGLSTYGKLIKKTRLLDEVIYDLREALYRYPVDVSIWQSLGDAYMRANRLQDALDAYTKAEELLR